MVLRISRNVLLLVVCFCVVGCDGATKYAATEMLAGEPVRSFFFDILRLSYAENTGSFLSLGANLPDPVRYFLFVAGPAAMLLCLVFVAVRNRWSGAQSFALVLLLSGGAANLADRIGDGSVVDFLNVGIGPIRTGIFNVADMAIMAGAFILLIKEYLRSREQPHE